MTAFTGQLACLRCGELVPAQQSATPCPSCAAEGLAIACLPTYDLSLVDELVPTEGRGVFRYPQLLPVSADAAISLDEGNTPLHRCDKLAAALGIPELYVKDETRNPTWSYKDRLAAIAVTQAVEAGSPGVVVSSTGNHGAAVAAYAAVAGIPCLVLTLESVPLEMKVLIQSYGSDIVALRTGPERWTVMAELVAERGWAPMSGYVDPPLGSNPYGVEGYKSIAYELFEQLGRVPDVVINPTAYGDGIAGIARGFNDLRDLGITSSVPRMVAADPLGAYEAGLKEGLGTRVPFGPTVSFSTGTPVATYQGLWAVESTNGLAVRGFGDAEILAAQADLARLEGLYVENSSATAVAAARALSSSGELRPDDQVVVIGSSTGLKDTRATAEILAPVLVIEATVAALDEALDRMRAE